MRTATAMLLLLAMLPTASAVASTSAPPPQFVGDSGPHLYGAGVGIALRGGVRFTKVRGFTGGFSAGVTLPFRAHFAIAGHGRVVLGGTVDPKPRVRVRVVASIGGGVESRGRFRSGRGGTTGGPWAFAGSRLSVLRLLPGAGRPRGAVGGYVGGGMSFGRVSDVVGPVPFIETGLVFEVGAYVRTGMRSRSP